MSFKIIEEIVSNKSNAETFIKSTSIYPSLKNPLNPINLLESFIKDLNLEEDFKEYCKMIFSLEKEKETQQ